ncbi:mitochondrial import inner membrane translocase subunit Tim9-like isoform X1 [Pocillopora damicornis]|uniref:mitochondrial import inner membrane translocase subunit Tim9-like isoform X1 n=1 Tax=Pocillopora damicornis TaxID=46731 RepID=UPI000F554EA2|nr:mitochondrial import inner membrane translocase subunit Tim9-like isoform X1 [Pocillopora damicornis]
MERFIADELAARNGHFKSSSVYIVEPLSVVEWLAVAKRLFLSVKDGQCKEVVVKRYKEFLQLYNKLTQNCFIACVTNMNYRKVTAEEESCIDKCSTKWMNLNQRQMAVFMEVGPLADKKMGQSVGQGM